MTAPRVTEASLTAQRALACSLLDEALRRLCPRPVGHPVVWDAGTIPAALQTFVATHGHLPTRQAWRQATRHALPGLDAVRRVYGSLAAAYRACGVGQPAREERRTHGEA
jgi:hypothetical protein